MSIDNAKSTLKVLGVLNIIFGIFGIGLAIAFYSGGHILGINVMNTPGAEGAEQTMTLAGTMLVLAVFVLISAIVDLLLGIFSIRGANHTDKIGPAFVLSIIALILSVISLILSFANGITFSSVLDGIVGIVFSACIFWAANTIRKNA